MKIVAAILSVFLFWGSLMPKNDFRELSKFSHLIEHFNEHSQENGLSFFDFIEMHYGSKKGEHKDEHDDKGCLPLQKSVSGTGVVFVFANHSLATVIPKQLKNKSVCFHIPAILSAQTTPPWHPPKA